METLNLTELLNLISEVPEYGRLVDELRQKNALAKADVIERRGRT